MVQKSTKPSDNVDIEIDSAALFVEDMGPFSNNRSLSRKIVFFAHELFIRKAGQASVSPSSLLSQPFAAFLLFFFSLLSLSSFLGLVLK